MRVDLMKSPHRPWFMSLLLRIARWRVGVVPGPPLTISYRPSFFAPDFRNFIMRGMRGTDSWDRGHAELFAAFVSNLNACHF